MTVFCLLLLQGNISKCNGCERSFEKTFQFLTDRMAVIGHSELDWYPYLYSDGSRPSVGSWEGNKGSTTI